MSDGGRKKRSSFGSEEYRSANSRAGSPAQEELAVQLLSHHVTTIYFCNIHTIISIYTHILTHTISSTRTDTRHRTDPRP